MGGFWWVDFGGVYFGEWILLSGFCWVDFAGWILVGGWILEGWRCAVPAGGGCLTLRALQVKMQGVLQAGAALLLPELPGRAFPQPGVPETQQVPINHLLLHFHAQNSFDAAWALGEPSASSRVNNRSQQGICKNQLLVASSRDESPWEQQIKSNK